MKALYISGIILFFYYIYKNYKSNNLITDEKYYGQNIILKIF